MRFSDRTQKARRNLFIATFVSFAVGVFDAKLKSTPYLELTLPEELNVLALGMIPVLVFLAFDYWVRLKEDKEGHYKSKRIDSKNDNLRIYEATLASTPYKEGHRNDAFEQFKKMEESSQEDYIFSLKKLHNVRRQSLWKDRNIPLISAMIGLSSLLWRVIYSTGWF